ncbi:MAG: hypothetical protein QGH42_11255 [Kiritimatiellia bacterium]|jgi:hypothetical protein|nr:hypothetical protein [Kiritimatiellia bacterium]MDP6631073.1 hypothetical protein [Kiritimatiellia bacterium]MDP6810029.1 hypothetical protein [Kiritimatiellia bacterium]MDP7024800.1 hypothetical protein [Kiritimatiellia bacterium]
MIRYGLTLVAVGLFLLPAAVLGQTELAAIMRDEYALGLTPTVRSAGMGGGYLGVEGVQSMNPAALARAGRNVTATYGIYSHDTGPDAHRGRIDATLAAPKIGGAARLMLDHVSSDGADPTMIAGGAPMEYDSTTLGLQYGRDVSDCLALGFGAYPYEEANVDVTTPGGTMSGEGMSQVGSIQFGALGRLCDMVNVGVQVIHIIDELQVTLPDGTKMQDDFKIDYVAAGVAITPWDGGLVVVDYWNGDVDGRSAPGVEFDADIDRWNIGVEQRVLDAVDLRVGSNNSGLTAGFTWRMCEAATLDYAYVSEALNDKADGIFGETEQHTVAVSCAF